MLKVRLAHHNGTAPCRRKVLLILVGHHYRGSGGQGAIVHAGSLAGVEEYGLQHGGAAEYVDTNACKRGWQGNLIELRAVLEHRVAYVGDTLGNLNGLQFGTSGKRPLAKFVRLLRHHDGVQVFAVLKCCYTLKVHRLALKRHRLKVVIVAEAAVGHCGNIVEGAVHLNVLWYNHFT